MNGCDHEIHQLLVVQFGDAVLPNNTAATSIITTNGNKYKNDSKNKNSRKKGNINKRKWGFTTNAKNRMLKLATIAITQFKQKLIDSTI